MDLSGSSRQNSQFEDEDPDRVSDFPPATSPFRGALDYEDKEQRKHKRRDSYFHDASWNPMKWITESRGRLLAMRSPTSPSRTARRPKADTGDKIVKMRKLQQAHQALPHLSPRRLPAFVNRAQCLT